MKDRESERADERARAEGAEDRMPLPVMRALRVALLGHSSLCCFVKQTCMLLPCSESCAESWLQAVALREVSRVGVTYKCGAVADVVGDFHRDHQQHVVEKMRKPICFRMNKMLLKCMLIMSSRFATFVATDLWRAFGERMRKRACVHGLWVACVRDFAGDR